MADQWSVSFGPDDRCISVKKNGEVYSYVSVGQRDMRNPYGAFKIAMQKVEERATVGDEIVLHFSDRF